MLMEKPQCNFQNCRYCFDGNCRSAEKYENCKLTDLHCEIARLTVDLDNAKIEWISVEEMLTEDGENVLIWVGKVESARIEKGISEEEREKMKNGELEDPIEYGWSESDGLKAYKRSQAYRGCDVFGNNMVPYCWKSTSGPMEWFGQYATHWMPLPVPPKGDEGK